MILPKQTISARASTCTCGCHGRDSWHRTWYTRSVTVDPADETKGTVRLPMSTQPVLVTRGPRLSFVRDEFIWDVVRDSIVFDK